MVTWSDLLKTFVLRVRLCQKLQRVARLQAELA
jgi:hypothetical protein